MKRSVLKAKIKSMSPAFSDTEKRIAEFITTHMHKSSFMTIHELSEKLGVADSTIFKFTRKLGYRGFRDFRNDLLSDQYDPQISVHENITSHDSLETIASKIFSSTVSSLDDTVKLLKEEDLERAVGIIQRANTLSFFGCGGSNIVAFDAYHKFLRSPVRCQYAADEHIQMIQASLLTDKDAAIVVSHSGLSRTTIQIADVLRENHVPIIFLSSYLNTYITKIANVTLISSSEETGYRAESLSSRIAQLVILDTLFCALMFRSDEARVVLHKVRSAVSKTKIE